MTTIMLRRSHAAPDPDTPRDLACELTSSPERCFPSIEEFDPLDVDLPSAGSAFTGIGSLIGSVLVALLVLVLVAAIVWIVRSGRGIAVTGDDDVDDLDEDVAGIAARIVDDGRPPARWREAAREHRAESRHRDAVRCEYRALVGDLARAGLVDEIPGRTSGEERRQLADLAPEVAPAFGVAADIFDAAWFDNGEVGADADDRFLVAQQQVLDHVAGGRVAVGRVVVDRAAAGSGGAGRATASRDALEGRP